MIRFYPILALCGALTLTSCSRRAYRELLSATTFPTEVMGAEQVAEEVATYQSLVDEVVPFPYIARSRAYIDSVAAAIVAEGEMPTLHFYERLQRLAGAYDLSHFFLLFPERNYREDLRQRGEGVFPYYLLKRENGVYLQEAFNPADSVFVGSRLLRINGLDADSLYTSFYAYSGGAETAKRYDVKYTFHRYLWLNGIHGPFTLEVERDGDNRKLPTAGYFYLVDTAKQEASSTSFDVEAYFRRNVSYSVVDSVAYLKVESLGYFGEEQFGPFLDSVFTDIQQRGLGRLIVDFRDNGGGNDGNGLALLRYIADRPYRLYGGGYRRVSRAYGRFFHRASPLPWVVRQLPYNTAIRILYKRHPEDRRTYGSMPTEKKPGLEDVFDSPLRFRGEVYFVINNGTYSSGVSVANAVEDFDLATLVGQPTGSVPNEHGENMQARLPHSGIVVILPSAYYIRANGNMEDQNPVLPEVYIPQERLDEMDAEALVREVTK